MHPRLHIIQHLTVMGLIAAVLAASSLAWRRDFPLWSDPLAISFEQTLDLGGSVVWVDTRTQELYDQGHWPGAVHLTDQTWDAGVARFRSAWQPGQPVVIYCISARCRTGHHVATRLVRDLGVPSRVLTGGWSTLQRHREAAP
jgi:rhodanese-related sulfurtransferase